MQRNTYFDYSPPLILPNIKGYIDYYPFGSAINTRSYSSGAYRYGFQAQEKDDEIWGEGNGVYFKYRIHDARLGRFLSVDPLSSSFPWNSPYAFSENRVISAIELEGLEAHDLNNEEIVYGPYSQNYIDGFNTTFNNASANGASITPDIWNFESYQNEESVVGNYLINFIQNLPQAPDDYVAPATFALSGVQSTYDAARQYANCWGNCCSTTASRVNQAYETLYGITPIDYTKNPNGTFTSTDYRTSSSQSGASNFGFGVGGALANGGEGILVDNSGVWQGELKPGAALQIWHSTDVQNLTQNGGHSQLFLNYTYDNNGEINGIDVFDNSGTIENLPRINYEGIEYIRGANLLDL